MKEIKLTRGKAALVADEDVGWLNQWKWYATVSKNNFTAVRWVGKTDNRHKAHMHRQIMNASEGEEIDHINHNTLDNRRENLRLCTHQQNSMNRRKRTGLSSIYKGVCWHKQHKKWLARIKINNKQFCLGYHKWEANAAKAYDEAAKKYFGEFACLNFSG